MRRLASGVLVALAAVAFGLVLLGAPVLVLQAEPVTAALVTRYSDPAAAGLSLPVVLDAAEKVRAYTTDPGAPDLPATVDGRPGFDATAASHLRDVRGVLVGARSLTIAAAALFGALFALALGTGRRDAAALALRVGSLGILVLAVVSAAAALIDFDGFFAVFHRLFFAAGTWTFPPGTLLIELFPEPLWANLGVLWALGVLGGAAVALLAAHGLAPRKRSHVGQEV